jgi:hypothetical protein
VHEGLDIEICKLQHAGCNMQDTGWKIGDASCKMPYPGQLCVFPHMHVVLFPHVYCCITIYMAFQRRDHPASTAVLFLHGYPGHVGNTGSYPHVYSPYVLANDTTVQYIGYIHFRISTPFGSDRSPDWNLPWY